jgi:hypothetical protein
MPIGARPARQHRRDDVLHRHLHREGRERPIADQVGLDDGVTVLQQLGLIPDEIAVTNARLIGQGGQRLEAMACRAARRASLRPRLAARRPWAAPGSPHDHSLAAGNFARAA